MPGLRAPRSGYFRKLALSYALVVAVAALAIGLLLESQLERVLVDDLERSLLRNCDLLAPMAAENFDAVAGSELTEELHALGEQTGQRLTWIRADGTVVADSHADPGAMGNHGNRPEVLQALHEEHGVARRMSATIGESLLYVARTVRDGDETLGVVRAAMPLRDVESKLAAMRRTMTLGAGLGALAALVVGLFAARRITRPIAEMTRAAEALRGGDLDTRMVDLPDDEIGVLGDAFNRLAEEITARLASTDLERARLRAMLTAMVEGVVAIDAEGRVLYSNHAASKLLDAGEAELEGERLWDRVRVRGLEELLSEAEKGGHLVRHELSTGRDGDEAILDAHASPLRGEGAGGVVVVLHDVTELRRLERIRRDFVANVSHELKTPLTSIQGFVETLLAGALGDTENNERFLRKIDRHVGRLNHLVGDLLSLARIESHEGHAENVPVDLGPVLADVAQRHEETLAARGQQFRLDRTEDPVVVLGDRESLVQVVDNLLDNAIKYTPRGGHVEMTSRHEGAHGVIEVADTGLGIPEEERDRVFERFYRVDKARSREIGGTGLGLSIVKHLVGAMDGEVDLESEPGRGSRFRVRIPLAG